MPDDVIFGDSTTLFSWMLLCCYLAPSLSSRLKDIFFSCVGLLILVVCNINIVTFRNFVNFSHDSFLLSWASFVLFFAVLICISSFGIGKIMLIIISQLAHGWNIWWSHILSFQILFLLKSASVHGNFRLENKKYVVRQSLWYNKWNPLYNAPEKLNNFCILLVRPLFTILVP